MRRIAFALATIAIAAPVAGSAPERFRGAERLGRAELQRVIPGMRLVHVVRPGDDRYRAIEIESFFIRSDRRARALRPGGGYRDFTVLYDGVLSGGAYRIHSNGLCTIVLEDRQERCRGLYRLSQGGYAISTFEYPHSPAIEVRISPIR